MSAPAGSSLVVFHENTRTPTTDRHSAWLIAPPRLGEVVNFIDRVTKGEFIGRVADIVWFLTPEGAAVVKVYLDPISTRPGKGHKRR